MTKQKTTKRALLMSFLSILLCVSMLIGTTYAWFTDSVTSAGNIIKSGTLDVTMEWKDATTTGKQQAYKDASEGPIFKYDLWEPGYVEAKNVKITNAGSLALKYKLNILPTGTVSELANVIDVYFAEGEITLANREMDELTNVGTLAQVLAGMPANMSGDLEATKSDTVTIALKMQESAGNEYQNKEIGSEFAIQLLATQLTAESDSFDDQYDKFADYDGEISTPDALIAALNNGGTFKLAGDVALDEIAKVPASVTVNLDLNGYKISGAMTKDAGDLIVNDGTLTIVGNNGSTITNTTLNGGALITNNGTLTLKGGNYVGAPIDTTGYPDYAIYSTGKLTIENGTSVTSDRGALNISGTTVINGGDFEVTAAASSRSLTAHTVYAHTSGSTLTINGGNFVNNYSGVSGASVICPAGSDITVNGGTFRDAEDSTANFNNTANFQNYMGYSAVVKVYGGTYDDITHTKWIADGYASVNNGDGTYTVSMNQATVDSVFDNAQNGDTITLSAGEYVIPDYAKNKKLKIVGDGNTTIKVQDDGGAEGDIDYSLEGADIVFENLTLNIQGSNYPGYARINSAVYNNCTIVGSNYTLYGNSEFNNCTFNLNNGYVWTWGAAKVAFNGCTFEDVVGGKAKAILVHNTIETEVTVKDCTFKATTPASTWDGIAVAAVSIDPENGSPDATVRFEGTNTVDSAFYALYQVKYADEVDDVAIFVNGAEVTVTAMK